MNANLLTPLPGPWRITFDTNPDLCNLRCVMCEENSIYNKHKRINPRIMDFNIIQKVVKSAKGSGLTEIIPSTMGEPLLYRDFQKLLRLLKNSDLKLNLTTNGIFQGLDVKRWAQIILEVASDVKISINGATKETAEQIMIGID